MSFDQVWFKFVKKNCESKGGTTNMYDGKRFSFYEL